MVGNADQFRVSRYFLSVLCSESVEVLGADLVVGIFTNLGRFNRAVIEAYTAGKVAVVQGVKYRADGTVLVSVEVTAIELNTVYKFEVRCGGIFRLCSIKTAVGEYAEPCVIII